MEIANLIASYIEWSCQRGLGSLPELQLKRPQVYLLSLELFSESLNLFAKKILLSIDQSDSSAVFFKHSLGTEFGILLDLKDPSIVITTGNDSKNWFLSYMENRCMHDHLVIHCPALSDIESKPECKREAWEILKPVAKLFKEIVAA